MVVIAGDDAIEYHYGTDEWGLCRLERGGVFEVESPQQERSRRHLGSIDDSAILLEALLGE